MSQVKKYHTRSAQKKLSEPSTSKKSEPPDPCEAKTPEHADSTSKTPEPENRPARPDSPDNCSICLSHVENKSFTDSCLHTFCYVCLLEWSKVKAVCPLCKQQFKKIIYNVRSLDDFDEYVIPPPQPQRDHLWENFNAASFATRFRYRTTMTNESRMAYVHAPRRHPGLISGLRAPMARVVTREEVRQRRRQQAIQQRRRIYDYDMWVRPVSPTSTLEHDYDSRYRETSPAFFTENEACRYALIPWLSRELNIILNGTEDNVHFVLELILDLIQRFEIRSDEFFELVHPLIGRHTRHFIHEFYHFARSPYDMTTYDQRATYENRPEVPEANNESEDDDVVVVDSQGPRQTLSQILSRESGVPLSNIGPIDVTWNISSTLGDVRAFLQNAMAEETGFGLLSGVAQMERINSLHNYAGRSERGSGASSANSQRTESTPATQPVNVDDDSDDDVIFVKYEKPYVDRSPIVLSSGSDEEMVERETGASRKRHKSSKHKSKHRRHHREGSTRRPDRSRSRSRSRHRSQNDVLRKRDERDVGRKSSPSGRSSHGCSDSRDQRSDSRDHRSDSRNQRSDSRDQRSDSRDHRSDSRDHRSDSRDHRSDSRDRRLDSRDHRSDSRDHRSDSRDHRSDSRDYRSRSRDRRSRSRDRHSKLRDQTLLLLRGRRSTSRDRRSRSRDRRSRERRSMSREHTSVLRGRRSRSRSRSRDRTSSRDVRSHSGDHSLKSHHRSDASRRRSRSRERDSRRHERSSHDARKRHSSSDSVEITRVRRRKAKKHKKHKKSSRKRRRLSSPNRETVRPEADEPSTSGERKYKKHPTGHKSSKTLSSVVVKPAETRSLSSVVVKPCALSSEPTISSGFESGELSGDSPIDVTAVNDDVTANKLDVTSLASADAIVNLASSLTTPESIVGSIIDDLLTKTVASNKNLPKSSFEDCTSDSRELVDKNLSSSSGTFHPGDKLPSLFNNIWTKNVTIQNPGPVSPASPDSDSDCIMNADDDVVFEGECRCRARQKCAKCLHSSDSSSEDESHDSHSSSPLSVPSKSRTYLPKTALLPDVSCFVTIGNLIGNLGNSSRASDENRGNHGNRDNSAVVELDSEDCSDTIDVENSDREIDIVTVADEQHAHSGTETLDTSASVDVVSLGESTKNRTLSMELSVIENAVSSRAGTPVDVESLDDSVVHISEEADETTNHDSVSINDHLDVQNLSGRSSVVSTIDVETITDQVGEEDSVMSELTNSPKVYTNLENCKRPPSSSVSEEIDVISTSPIDVLSTDVGTDPIMTSTSEEVTYPKSPQFDIDVESVPTDGEPSLITPSVAIECESENEVLNMIL